MPAYYSRTLPAFLADSHSTVIGELTRANAAARFPLSPEAIDAWAEQLQPLTSSIRELIEEFPQAADWQILLEYPIPMIGKRIDAVLLARDFVVVIETKTGTSRTAATRQVEDYAISLACFHEGSAGRVVVPLVITNGAAAIKTESTVFDRLIEPCQVCTFRDCPETLRRICQEYSEAGRPAINPASWDQSRFKPVPTIIAAAVALYSDMNVFEIGHSCTAREDLDITTETIVSAVQQARTKHQKIICFVTGVPGAGKTLVGLNAVHRPEIRESGSFLSGNGPLVKVIQEALVRDVTKHSERRTRVTRREAEIQVKAFVHNVHRFADEYYREGQKIPAQKVVVFDEAQRAWDAAQNQQAKRPPVSEPKMMLDVMDRHDDWAVIVALVGGGQEINRGEAGLAEWGRSLPGFPDWQVWASPYVLSENAPSNFRLFEDDHDRSEVLSKEQLHLRVCTRSIRAQRISDWVDAVLSGNANKAGEIARMLPIKPFVTRSLPLAKQWLESNRRGMTRSGLVASAYAARLRADGLESDFEFHRGFAWEHWFLDSSECDLPSCSHQYCNDVRASSRLEVVATQFEIQGLELDWIGVCWGEDLLWEGEKWELRRFNNKRWRILPEAATAKRSYQLNAYRVLLTRARHNMVIYVPQPNPLDDSRLPKGLDRTWNFLCSCGANPLVTYPPATG